jgi:hypothetical protein
MLYCTGPLGQPILHVTQGFAGVTAWVGFWVWLWKISLGHAEPYKALGNLVFPGDPGFAGVPAWLAFGSL